MREFKDVLKGLREEKRYSQKELADRLHLGASTIGMYENGSRMPKYEILEILADFFNVDMNYLLGKTPIRNSYRDGDISQWGDDRSNREHLSDKPELLNLYNEIRQRDEMFILFDKVKDLSPEDVESVLSVVNTIRKAKGFEE